jgi:UDP-N-acetyl-D-glucosamine/UDP-N-acetyl-D-galactosamine dehydrogenase
MFDLIKQRKTKIGVIGLGYVGLPIAIEFAKKYDVVGFDIKPERIEQMKNKIDPSKELSSTAFENINILFTCNLEDLREVTFFIVAVPTPIDIHNLPDLTPLIKASQTVGKVLKKGDYVVFESTVYPGCTEDDCVPVLEKESGLKFKDDFKIGYSPERINPGDTEHTLTKILKIVSGCDQESLEVIADVYESIIEPGVYKASSIKVAEAAKIIENTQRDVNIALMNELSIIFNKIGINTMEVLEAAGTKWNFLKFSPGLVGGHCIGVDPYYLTHKAKELGYHARIITAGRAINDGMGAYIASNVVKKLVTNDKDIRGAKALIMGVTFKENVSDIRNSKVVDVYNELKSYGIVIDVVDPNAKSEEVLHEYGFGLINKPQNNYDIVIIAVNHKEYIELDEKYFLNITTKDAIIVDVKSFLKDKIKKMHYWSL